VKEPGMDSSLHSVILHTLDHEPLLAGALKPLAERCLQNLPRHYPGLRLVEFRVFPERVEMVLDLHRLDEDLSRIVQFFKADLKALAQANDLDQGYFWQWGYDEK
jgi:hypothetical protein